MIGPERPALDSFVVHPELRLGTQLSQIIKSFQVWNYPSRAISRCEGFRIRVVHPEDQLKRIIVFRRRKPVPGLAAARVVRLNVYGQGTVTSIVCWLKNMAE